ncbi:VOC family protein [Streptomyces sp. NPDC004610]|uniref:VOC family protein n=1 Tax=unclassified Streptomyces TaxID=2593676 RepID=UPI0033B52F5D
MTVQPQGTPVWADAMFTDIEGAKNFYAEVLGWTYGEAGSEFGNYTQAFADGRSAAAVMPPMPGQDGVSQWCLYLASPDIAATAAAIRANGGQVLMEPMQVADFGSMCLASDPGGVVFGVWQAGTHQGFEAPSDQHGAYCWAEVFTRDPDKSDAFFPAVFPYTAQQMDDAEMDFRIYSVQGEPVLGRMRMTDDFPPEVPPYINVYFNTTDCDDTVARAVKLGGTVRFGPVDSPFGRFAALSDPYGANFSVLDTTRLTGEVPGMADVS